MASLSFFVLLLEWSIRLVFVPVIAIRLRPPAALAWVAVVSIQPFLGLAFYLVFGENRLPKRRIAAHARIRRSLQLDIHPLLQQFWVDPDLSRESHFKHLLSVQLGEMPAVGGNQFELLDDTQSVIDAIIADIDSAQQHVHMLFYIWRDDETGQRVCDALLAARQRGVVCRVLVDAVGSSRFLRSPAIEQLRMAGIEVHAILPVNLFRRRISRIDMRNHRKLVVIDGTVAYTGSQNIVNADYGTRKLNWHDLMMRLTGPIVLQLQAVFETDWYAETSQMLDKQSYYPPPAAQGDCVLELFPSGPTYRTQNLHRLLVAAIYLAHSEIVITTPYFVPDDSLMQAIEVARLRGVAIKLVLPAQSDQILVSAAQRSFYDHLLEMDVEIHLYQPGLLHSKTLTLDNRFALVGTSNMDIRSFALNLELNLIMFDEASVGLIVDQQQKYLADTIQLHRSDWSNRPAWKTLGDALARLLAPLL